ncbi:MAG TPA: alpha/beta fold hydrolase [Candidatus Binataceae bacterium]|jgi:pimeloyl-ACP methyl ester carboxylesterase|nr:alpha/beta fold hydrolase [Candidatus Binataceae bacterium]
MNPISIGRELVSAWALAACYPFDCLTILQAQIPRRFRQSRDAVILIHGNGGDRTNLLTMSILLRLNGFDNIGFFSYSARQSVEISASQCAEMAAQADGGGGVHLIGHSLGGTIARLAAARSAPRRIRSLVTLGAPWWPSQHSADEVAIFGSDDPIVRPPPGPTFHHGMFKRLIVLRNTGHLAVLHHDEALRVTVGELIANRPASA